MAFKKAERTQLYLRCALFGPSGSGKTMTALRMAKGIAGKMGTSFAVIDTEARSASKYADRFGFEVDDLEKKTVDHYITSMNEAKRNGCKVLVIDSLSHAWRELTDEVDRITQNSQSKNSFQSWAKVNPKQKLLVETILNYPGHIIATMRSKTEWVIGEGKNGKIAPEKLGLAPEQGKGIEYEFDLLVELNQQHQAVVTKDRTGKFQDETIDKPGEDFGVALYEWLGEGAALPMETTPVVSKPETPQTAPAVTNTASPQEPSKTKPASSSKTTEINAKGDEVITAIGEILNTVDAKGQRYFSEADKAEARELVDSVKKGEPGLIELRSLKDFLTGELVKRENSRKAA